MDRSSFFLSLLVCLLPVLQACPPSCHCHGGDLQHVICDNVGLKKIPKVPEQTRLLNLQRNNFPVLPTNAFREMKGLVSLHLQHSHIKEISSGAFRGLKQLVYLYLSNNDISVIKMGAFDDLTELTYLYMDNNKISDLPKGLLSPMINLFILQLGSNKIRELRSGAFSGTKDLRWLYLSDNSLSSIQPGALDDVENLAIFHLDKNQLSTYPVAAMNKLRVVEDLKLSHNPMKVIPDNAFQSFGRYLETLSLDNTGLEKVSSFPLSFFLNKQHKVKSSSPLHAATLGTFVLICTHAKERRLKPIVSAECLSVNKNAAETLKRFIGETKKGRSPSSWDLCSPGLGSERWHVLPLPNSCTSPVGNVFWCFKQAKGAPQHMGGGMREAAGPCLH